jgi:hypothetical protein
MADDPEALTDAQINERFGKLETAQTEQGSKLDRVLAILSRPGGAPPAAPPGADPAAAAAGSIQEQIRAELERAGKTEMDEREKAESRKSLEDLRAQLKALAEVPPKNPVRRVTSVMFGTDPE